jgi:hypothetical protein
MMTLDDIEHNTIRKNFNEPIIHFALVCAAYSCPKLLNHAYFPDNLDLLLEEQAKHFFSSKKHFYLEKNKVYISKILDWYGEDFVNKYYDENNFKWLSKKENSIINFAKNYVDNEIKDFLLNNKFSIEYIPYNWELNEK